ncbi:MAG: hypothetical protein HY721_30735, partial [Planctomycetes bacterium]|nr:hypothetical protein [Planctomycetota bacterium]
MHPDSRARRSLRVHVLATGIAFSLAAASPPLLRAQQGFLRGDSNGDRTLDISDALYSLGFLFLGTAPPACADAADANDDGQVDISDASFTLGYLFLGSKEPPAPGPSGAGPDPTPDDLGCGPPLEQAPYEPPELQPAAPDRTRCQGCGNPWLGDIAAAAGTVRGW